MSKKLKQKKNYEIIDLYDIMTEYSNKTLLLEDIGEDGEELFKIHKKFESLDDATDFIEELDATSIPEHMVISTPDIDEEEGEESVRFIHVEEGEILFREEYDEEDDDPFEMYNPEDYYYDDDRD